MRTTAIIKRQPTALGYRYSVKVVDEHRAANWQSGADLLLVDLQVPAGATPETLLAGLQRQADAVLRERGWSHDGWSPCTQTDALMALADAHRTEETPAAAPEPAGPVPHGMVPQAPDYVACGALDGEGSRLPCTEPLGHPVYAKGTATATPANFFSPQGWHRHVTYAQSDGRRIVLHAWR